MNRHCLSLMLACLGATHALAQSTPAPTTALEQARAAAERRDWAAAIAAFNLVLQGNPPQASLWVEAARLSGFADRNAEAAERYQRALALDPSLRASLLPSLAWQTLWGGDAAKAVTLFQECTQAQWDGAKSWDGLAQALDQSRQPEAAILAWRQSLALRPQQPVVERRLARALLWSDQFQEAHDLLSAMLQRDPADRESGWLLANVQNFAGEPQRAAQSFRHWAPPRTPGERMDVARAWAWAGFEERALASLGEQTQADVLWWRDHRPGRELKPFVWGAWDSATDRDGLRSDVWASGAGLRPWQGATAELRFAHKTMRSPQESLTGQEAQASLRWRHGEPMGAFGVLWPSVGLGRSAWEGQSQGRGFVRLAWLPVDRWRLDAELAREGVDTPLAVAERVRVNSQSLGVGQRPHPRLGWMGGFAHQQFVDGNRRDRWNGKLDWRLPLAGRWNLGLEGVTFSNSKPNGPLVPSRGYWNPAHYEEVRVTGAWAAEFGPQEWALKIGVGQSSELDGWGQRTRGQPDSWELAWNYELKPSAQLRLRMGGAGSGMGLGSGGSGYWRRYSSAVLNVWF
jgi:Flp pilus assembly protein TadD